MFFKGLTDLIFGDGKTPPKNPKLHRPEKPTKHWGSKKPQNKKKNRAAAKRARMSRKVNRHG